MRMRGSNEGGTISILAVGAIVAVITSATLAVDLGRVAWSSRDQQGATDRAALDAVRAIADLWDVETTNWNGYGTYDAQARATDLAVNSLAENTGAEGRATDIRVTEVYIGNWDEAASEFCVWHGTIKSTPGNCHDEFPTAVFVQTTSTIDALFVGSAMTDSGQVVKESIAQIATPVELTVGSTLVSVDADQAALLNEIWGDEMGPAPDVVNLNLAVADYNGLLVADVALGGLFTELGFVAGTPSSVVESASFSVADVLTASASALTNQGDAASLTAAAVIAQLATDVDNSLMVTMGDFMTLTTGHVGSIFDLEFNAFDLVRGAIGAGDGNNFASVENIEAIVPGLASGALDATLIEPAQTGFGLARWNAAENDWYTKVLTSQLDVTFDATLNAQPYLGYDPLDILLPLRIQAGRAEGAATSAWCLQNGALQGGTTLTQTAASTVWIGGAAANDWATVTTLSFTDPLLGTTVDIAEVQIRATQDTAASAFEGYHDPLPETVTGGGQTINLPTMLDPGNFEIQTVILGLNPLGALDILDLQNTVVAALQPVLADVETTLIEPLAELTGLHLGEADTTLDQVPGSCEGGRFLAK